MDEVLVLTISKEIWAKELSTCCKAEASTARAVTSACLLAADLARGEITEKITQRLGLGRSSGRGGHFLRRPERLLRRICNRELNSPAGHRVVPGQPTASM